VATFYTMYKRTPCGQHIVSVCTNTLCAVLGGDALFAAAKEHLGIGNNETTPDGSVSLEHIECNAACDYAPVMTVNYEYFDKVDDEIAVGLVKQLQSGERPRPTRGARLCTLKEMSVQLAGFTDERAEAMADGPAGEPTLAGNRLAERHGIAVPGFDPETPIRKQDETSGTGPGHQKPAAAPKAASDGKPAGEGPTPQKEVAK
jgi:NADH-quinone oxidoreductase subunit E